MKWLILFLVCSVCVAQDFQNHRRKSFRVVVGGCDSINDSSLKSYYAMNEASGSTAIDTKGGVTLNSLNTVGTTAGGVLGSARTFTAASSQYLYLFSDNASFSISGDKSISFWMKLNATNVAYQGIAQKNDPGQREWKFTMSEAGNALNFRVYDASENQVETISTNRFNPSVWYFVCATWTASDKKARLIIGSAGTGVLGTVAVTGALPGAARDGTSFTHIGYGASYMDGAVDELSFSDRLYTADEITALFNAGAGCKPSGL